MLVMMAYTIFADTTVRRGPLMTSNVEPPQPHIADAYYFFLQTDWMELATSLAFPSWSDGIRPCVRCNACGEDMVRCLHATPLHFPHRLNTERDYFDACTRCEVLVELDALDHRLLGNLLYWDMRSHRGRLLAQDLPRLGLMAGDRLEPSLSLPDVGSFEAIRLFPCTVTFWRFGNDTIARHRNPLFDYDRARTPQRCLVGDELHALSLGLFNRLARKMLWSDLAPDHPGAAPCGANDIQVNLLSMRHELYHWYKMRHAADPLERLTRISDFGPRVVGSTPDSALKTKGAETWGLLLFLVDRLSGRDLPDGAADLLTGARALVRMMLIWKKGGRTLQTSEVQESFDCYNEFLAKTRDFDDLDLPKKHMLLHMLERLTDVGNPTFYSNWLNESLNKLLKACCRQVSQHTFESGILIRMRALLRKRARTSTKRTCPY